MICPFGKVISSDSISYRLSKDICLVIVEEAYIQSAPELTSTSVSISFSLPQMRPASMYEFESRTLIWLEVISNSKGSGPFNAGASPISLLGQVEASVNLSTNTSVSVDNSSFLNHLSSVQ